MTEELFIRIILGSLSFSAFALGSIMLFAAIKGLNP